MINLPELRKSIGWVTSTLPAQIPFREKVIRTVVSGKFAQIGYLEEFGGEASGKDYAQAENYLAQMGCDALRNEEFGVLSQGEQQKVLIARARMTKPYLIVLDEPCAGMDPGARENFLATLQAGRKAEKYSFADLCNSPCRGNPAVVWQDLDSERRPSALLRRHPRCAETRCLAGTVRGVHAYHQEKRAPLAGRPIESSKFHVQRSKYKQRRGARPH